MTIAPYSPRSNGKMERQWRTHGNATRAMLQKSRLPRNFAWYALAQSVKVRNTLPIADKPDECPYSLFTGKKPSASQFRVFGCVCYAKIYDRVTKMSNEAVRCVNLGPAPNQSGVIAYDVSTRKRHTAQHCRFVESSCPGLTVSDEGWDEIVPEFADEYDSGATRTEDAPEFDEGDGGGAPRDPLKRPSRVAPRVAVVGSKHLPHPLPPSPSPLHSRAVLAPQLLAHDRRVQSPSQPRACCPRRSRWTLRASSSSLSSSTFMRRSEFCPSR